MTTRESWLQAAADAMRPWLADVHAPCGPCHVSIGFPSRGALALKSKRIGECWGPEVSVDGTPHIFVSPIIVEGTRALDVLLHEMVHAAVGTECGHRGPFTRTAKAVGLIGKMTATEAGPELLERLTALQTAIGKYPHAALSPAALQRKKQTTRMMKVSCAEDDYVIRMSRATMLKGLPECPVCHVVMTAAGMPTDDDASEDE